MAPTHHYYPFRGRYYEAETPSNELAMRLITSLEYELARCDDGFVRVQGSYLITWGDGGHKELDYSLCRCGSLMDAARRKRFCHLLLSLGKGRPDWHEKEPVNELLDPNLCPYLFSDAELERFAITEWYGEEYGEQYDLPEDYSLEEALFDGMPVPDPSLRQLFFDQATPPDVYQYLYS